TAATRNSTVTKTLRRYPRRSKASARKTSAATTTRARGASLQPTPPSGGALPPRTTSATPKASATSASPTGTAPGPGSRQDPNGSTRLSHSTPSASRARAPPPARSVVRAALVGGTAAREIVDGAGAERALVGREPGHQRRHFLRPSHPPHGNLGDEEIHRALLHLLEELGADHRRRHRVDEDAAGGHFLGQG